MIVHSNHPAQHMLKKMLNIFQPFPVLENLARVIGTSVVLVTFNSMANLVNSADDDQNYSFLRHSGLLDGFCVPLYIYCILAVGLTSTGIFLQD